MSRWHQFAEKQKSRDHFTSFCWYCWHLQVASWSGHGLPTDELCVQIHGCISLIIWNHNAICSFGWHSTTHLFAVHCRVLSQVCWLKEWYLGHQISSLAALRWSANADCHMVEEKGREGGASRKSEKIQLPFLPGKKSPRGVKSQGRLNSEDLQWWICEVLGAGHPVWKALPLWELGWRSWSHGGRELSVV